MQDIIDALDAAAKAYPIKALADEIGKGESTLRNELNRQQGYKLGLHTALNILDRTGDLTALDKIEARYGRVAFRIPACTDSCSPLMRLVARLTKEFGEHTEAVAYALEDGSISQAEAEKILAELRDVMSACLELQGYLEKKINGGAP